ncbi:hypothetical protein GCM10018952_22660 [Streptosporangium vulgare]
MAIVPPSALPALVLTCPSVVTDGRAGTSGCETTPIRQWADLVDDAIPVDVVERITAPVTDVWVDVLCNPSCPPGDHEPYRDRP